MIPRMGNAPRRQRVCALLLAAVLASVAEAGPLGLPVPSPAPVLRNTIDKVRDTADKATDTVHSTTDKVTDTLTGAVESTLDTAGIDPAGRPIDPAAFEFDENGARVVHGVVIAIAFSNQGRAAARALDIAVAHAEDLTPLGIQLTRLAPPPGMPVTEALKALRAADPAGTYDLEHVYDPAGTTTGGGAPSPAPSLIAADDITIGMIDAGIDTTHPALQDADIETKVTTERRRERRPTAHGTAVASLLVGDDEAFKGALPGATLYAADAFAGSPTGGAAGDIARAIAWLSSKDIAVINVSITGPDNALLAAAVRAAVARGHVIVAPVGNDGPSASVRYPAAYDGVVAVTSVDAKGRVQLDANRGPAVDFAAMGVNVRAAQADGGYANVTGTSFASPLVAARFAELVASPNKQEAAEALAALASTAKRSPDVREAILGHGILTPRIEAASAKR